MGLYKCGGSDENEIVVIPGPVRNEKGSYETISKGKLNWVLFNKPNAYSRE